MRLAILADIHGNLVALKAVLADLEARGGADHLIVLGDLVGGPRPTEVIQTLIAHDAICIRGNRGDYMLDYGQHERQAPGTYRTGKQWAFLRHCYALLDDASLAYLGALPAQRRLAFPPLPPIRVVHGSPNGVSDILWPQHDAAIHAVYLRHGIRRVESDPAKLGRVMAALDEPILVCGHTHIPWCERRGMPRCKRQATPRCRRHDDWLAVNPGSAGQSINDDPRAHYALIESVPGASAPGDVGDVRLEMLAIDYDIEAACDDFVTTGSLAAGGAFARAAYLATRTGHDYCGYLMHHVARHVAALGYPRGAALPDAVWDDAVAAFDWSLSFLDAAPPATD